MQKVGIMCKITCVVTCMLVLLTGCEEDSTKSVKTADIIKQMYNDLTYISSDVKFLCDSGQSILEYDAFFEYNKDNGYTITMEKPDSISGIVIKATGDYPQNIAVQYKDTVLDGTSTEYTGASAADSVPATISLLKNEIPSEIWNESQSGNDFTVVRYENMTNNDASITHQLWLDKNTNYPSYSEVYIEGKRVIQLFFSEFQTN